MKPETIHLREVSLNVNNIEKLSDYYQQTIGLAILSENGDEVLLGVKETKFPLVRLVRINGENPEKRRSGLYHLAIRVPSRTALGDFLYHILLTKAPVVGASNHGYSEAIYLEDLEGNGIEVYCDRPVEEWDIKDDGRIIGITEAMDAEGVLASAVRKNEDAPYYLPSGTDMGHVHLSVSDVDAAKRTWMELLGLEDKFSVPTGSWLAVGLYHHHLAFNEWGGKHLEKRQKNQPGLREFRIIVENREEYDWIKRQAAESDTVSIEEHTDEMLITDSFGITLRVGMNS